MPSQIFKTHASAAAKVRALEKKGVYDANIGMQEYQLYPGTRNTRTRKTYTVYWTSPRSNPGRKKAKKASPSKRVSSALSRFLKRQNPAFKRASGVRVQKLKGGVIKLSPMK
jgi:hypothetical protein